MRITRLYTGEDQQSHFEFIPTIRLYRTDPVQKISKLINNSGCQFYEIKPNFVYDWHNTIQRCYFMYLNGEQIIETGDGTRQKFGVGDIILAEDKTGQGHKSWVISQEPVTALIIQLEERS